MIDTFVNLPWQLQVVTIGLIGEFFFGLSYILKARYPDTAHFHLAWGISDLAFLVVFVWGTEHVSLRYLILAFFYLGGAISNFYRIGHPRKKPIQFTDGQRSGAVAFLFVSYLVMIWAVTTG